MDTRLLSIIGLLLVIFIAAMLGNSGIVGYSSTRGLKEYPYEGFAEIQGSFLERDDKKDEKKDSTYASVDEAFGPMNSTTSLPSTPQDESPALKVAGFKGLQSKAYADDKIIGFMYNNDSNTTCKPYGYTNSKGNICLSPEDIKLLTTRGGNALGASDQIGK